MNMGSNKENEQLIADDKIVPMGYGSTSNGSIQNIAKDVDDGDCTREYTIGEAIEHIGFGKFQIRLILSVAMAVFSDAVQLLTPAVLGVVLECESWKLSKVAVAWLTTAIFIGKAVCAPIIGLIIDKFGRRKGLLLTLIFAPVFAALSALSPSFPYLVASRLLIGCALAGVIQICGFIEEFMPTIHRRKAMLTQLFWPLGGLWTSGFGLLMIYYYGLSWKWYLLVMSAPLFITVVTVFLLPESARFLGALGKFDKVDKILKDVGKENKAGLPNGNLSRSMFASANSEIHLPKASFKDLFSGGNLRTTVPLLIMWFAAGFLYYGIILLISQPRTEKVVDAPKCTSFVLSDYTNLMWTGFAELPGAVIAFFSLEYFGRKKTLLIQFIIVGCTFIPSFFHLSNTANFIAILIARAVCQSSIGSLIIYTPEVYPIFLRGRGIGVANMLFRIGSMVVPLFFQATVDYSFNLIISIYISCSFAAAICAIVLPKETKGIELEN